MLRFYVSNYPPHVSTSGRGGLLFLDATRVVCPSVVGLSVCVPAPEMVRVTSSKEQNVSRRFHRSAAFWFLKGQRFKGQGQGRENSESVLSVTPPQMTRFTSSKDHNVQISGLVCTLCLAL